MQYPLTEKIGHPELLVGRKEMFDLFDPWLKNIPKRISKSRVILARRKSGKTAFIQRIYNRLWSEHGSVIPFYLDIAENKQWYPNFAIDYYTAFASQFISFRDRDPGLAIHPLTIEEILQDGDKYLSKEAGILLRHKEKQDHDLLWKRASWFPHRIADLYDTRVLVMLDEFQNLAQYIYRRETCEGLPDESMPGSFHSLSESKIAPMLVTGSYVGWLTMIMGKYLQAGRLTNITMSPYLTPEEGLEAVYKYAEIYQEPITNQTAQLINELCMSDPFFISCVIQSTYRSRALDTEEGVINTVNYEIRDRKSEMSKTWAEYIQLTLPRINDRHAKDLLLFLSKNNQRYWTPQELKEKLNLPLTPIQIQERLMKMVESDMIDWGSSDIDFRGLQDGTVNLILRNRFEKEISTYEPNLKQEFQEKIDALRKDKQRLQGRINYLEGKLAENLLATEFRSKKRFHLSEYFNNVHDNRRLTLVEVYERAKFHRPDGKEEEIDVLAHAKDGAVLMVEVKNRKEQTKLSDVEDLLDNTKAYAAQHDCTVIPAFLSLNGFTDDAIQYCQANQIAYADHIAYAK